MSYWRQQDDNNTSSLQNYLDYLISSFICAFLMIEFIEMNEVWKLRYLVIGEELFQNFARLYSVGQG